MKRLILSGSHGSLLLKCGRGDVAVIFLFRFSWGELPSREASASYLGDGSDLPDSEEHWSDYVVGSLRDEDCESISLADFCEGYDEVELWFDPTPEDQLLLIWLLDYLSSHPDLTSRLRLRLLDLDFIGLENAFLAKGNIPVVPVTTVELEMASRSWQAYRSETPEACFELLERDLTGLPLWKPALADLLRELPGPQASERRSSGCWNWLEQDTSAR